jgi:glycosyltransferase involved in cell wall biosynthesis
MYMYFEVWDVQPKVKVTIGFCVKNCEATVKEAIGSIICQDYPHDLMEVIVVDGYSKDRTIKIVKEALHNSDIKTRIFFEDKGLGVARQIVVDNAVGDYIVWVDGDMVLAKDHVSKQVEFMEYNPRVGIAGGKFQNYPRENLVAALESIEWIASDYVYGGNASFRPILHRAGGCIYRVKAIRQIGGFDVQIKGALEDLDAEYRIGDLGWLTYFITEAIFHDRRKETWKAIWNENFWYGYGGHYFMHKYRRRMQASAIFEGLRRMVIAYKLTRRKIVFLFPLQYFFKKIAWFFGFLKAHIDNYGHNCLNMR